MRNWLFLVGVFALVIIFTACRKNNSGINCFPNDPTVRQIVNKRAIIKITGTINDVYLVEEGAIDSKLIPCNLPAAFYENDLWVMISGEVKATAQHPLWPCCSDNFVITKIKR